MQLPEQLLVSLESVKGFDKADFEKVHTAVEQITSVRFNPLKSANKQSVLLDIQSRVPWAKDGYYLTTRPSFTFDPLFHAGTYYVQEASSMFMEQALKQTVDLSKPLKVLDLCASPGGKSTHIQSLISKESLLVSNEVIRSRANVLKDNIIKWGCENVVVTNNDPKDFSALENYFDVIVVDAPCSGSGLFRRDAEAINEWSENNVQLCSQRQQRILADIWPSLKKDGILIYSTCSYSKEEDEEIEQWVLQNLPAINIPLSVEKSWGIVQSNEGYRFWPDKVKGEGFFITCFKKTAGETDPSFKTRNKPDQVSKKESGIINQWVKSEGSIFIRHLNTVYAWPEKQFSDFSFLLEKLRVIYSGVLVGELIREKLIPDHALAMNMMITETISKTELNEEQAIKYLQRKELNLAITVPGWQLVTCKGYSLGWINVLTNRINNYYPKELRILKDG
jgi:16S rRNA C967 or C1407 C5-methylase (RsmB/RsmF family)/NOL1/NOP2/fmu family ribosome biogenesis protein